MKNQGFTLVELMITMLIVGIITGAIFSAYQTMQRSYVAQDQVAEMQQNLRNAMDFIVQELRMAGYDPTRKANTGIMTASRGTLRVTTDVTNDAVGTDDDGDGDHNDLNEDLSFFFLPDINGNATDAGNDGIADAGAATFGIQNMNTNTTQELAQNVVAVEFNYILKDETETLTPTAGDLDKIRNVQITMLVRADAIDPNHSDTGRYETGSGANWGPFNDNYRRRLQITTVQCRNLGL